MCARMKRIQSITHLLDQKVKRIVSNWPMDSSSLSSGFRLSRSFLPPLSLATPFGTASCPLCSAFLLSGCSSLLLSSASSVANGHSVGFCSNCACCCCCCSFSICSNFWRTMLEWERPMTCSDILRRCADGGHWLEKDTLRWLSEWLSVASRLPRVR